MLTPSCWSAFLSRADRAIATQAQHPRAANPAWLQARAAELGFDLEVSASVPRRWTWPWQKPVRRTSSAAPGRSLWLPKPGKPGSRRQGMCLPPCDPVFTILQSAIDSGRVLQLVREPSTPVTCVRIIATSCHFAYTMLYCN